MELTDLHVHSTASDGTLTPAELVKEAKRVGLKAFALTDHDTINGIEEAMECAKIENIELIPGIEISCSYTSEDVINKEIHIVGLFIDYKSEVFKKRLADQLDSRDERNARMIKIMNEAGIDITMEKMIEMFGLQTIITRAHFASYLKTKGYVKSNNEAFEKYLGDGKPFYINRKKLDPKEAIQIIKEAHGVAILAHPILYNLSESQLKKMAISLKKAGLTGIEAIYSTYQNGDETIIRRIAKECGLSISGGSDFHGTNKPYIHLGIGRGNLKIPYEIAVNLKNSIYT